MSHIRISVILLVLLLAACKNRTVHKSQIKQLATQEKESKCALLLIKTKVANVWDQVNVQLESNLKDEIPQQELKNILKVRNAKLIRMFQTYDQLAPNIKTLIAEADSLDQLSVQELLIIKSNLNSITIQKRQLFDQIENKVELQTFKKLYQEILKIPC